MWLYILILIKFSRLQYLLLFFIQLRLLTNKNISFLVIAFIHFFPEASFPKDLFLLIVLFFLLSEFEQFVLKLFNEFTHFVDFIFEELLQKGNLQ